MITRVHVFVEGETERLFVRDVLKPVCEPELDLISQQLLTSPGHKGGIPGYASVRRQILSRCKQEPRALVTTMFDLYALPNDFPGKKDPDWVNQRSGHDKACLIEQRMWDDINQANFRPYISVHEFEALLFTDPQCFAPFINDRKAVSQLQAIRNELDPEEINDNPNTAPSKRIIKAYPPYRKRKAHIAPQVAAAIGIERMSDACPHFMGWYAWLLAKKFV